MGIQLDWQIESERQERRSTEDPAVRRQRRLQRRKLLFAVLMVAVVLAGTVGAVLWRLNDVENRMRNDLLDTVDAEVRALKVGNESNYMSIRRSGSNAWIGYQQETFAEYQRLKADGTLQLTGRVLDVEMDIDESRARVTVEEIFNGEPHAVVWFYWYYSDDEQDGWRRVPPDVEFWGEAESVTQDNVRIQYERVDTALGQELAAVVPGWWQTGCEMINCGGELPTLTVQVDPRWTGVPGWDSTDRWTLRIASPYNDRRAPQNNVLTPELRAVLGQLLAERIVMQRAPTGANLSATLAQSQTEAYLDGQWLATEFERWLRVGMLGQQQQTFLESMKPLYGDAAPPLMLRMLSTNLTLGAVFNAAAGTNLQSLPVEILNSLYWHDYFEYRLRFEAALLRNEFGLSDTQQVLVRHDVLYVSSRDGLAAAQAVRQRFLPSQPAPLVTRVNVLVGLDGRPVARVTVTFGADAAPDEIDFQWDSDLGTWKRLNS